MTAENWKIQVNVKIGDTLVNLRGEDSQEITSILGWAEQNATTIASTIAALHAQGNVAAAFPGSVNVAPPAQEQGWSQQGSQQAPPAFAQPQQAAPQGGGYGGPPTKWDLSGPPGPASACAHGQMEWRHRTAKSGKEYKGWFCPSKNQADQCDAQFIR